jgi:hypothetical protein
LWEQNTLAGMNGLMCPAEERAARERIHQRKCRDEGKHPRARSALEDTHFQVSGGGVLIWRDLARWMNPSFEDSHRFSILQPKILQPLSQITNRPGVSFCRQNLIEAISPELERLWSYQT